MLHQAAGHLFSLLSYVFLTFGLTVTGCQTECLPSLPFVTKMVFDFWLLVCPCSETTNRPPRGILWFHLIDLFLLSTISTMLKGISTHLIYSLSCLKHGEFANSFLDKNTCFYNRGYSTFIIILIDHGLKTNNNTFMIITHLLRWTVFKEK